MKTSLGEALGCFESPGLLRQPAHGEPFESLRSGVSNHELWPPPPSFDKPFDMAQESLRTSGQSTATRQLKDPRRGSREMEECRGRRPDKDC